MSLVVELEKYQRERTEGLPFETLLEFEEWADAVSPLLSFNTRYSHEFDQRVTAATVTFRMNNPIDSATNMNDAIGILNQAIKAVKINGGNQPKVTEESKEPVVNDKKSAKERFENDPVIFGCGLLITGFLAGMATLKFIFPPEPKIQEKIVTIPSQVECKVDGLPLLSEAHDKRVSAMQVKLLELETLASDRSIISPYQDNYLASANRLRQDIDTEKSALNEAIKQLNVSCKEMHNKSSKKDAQERASS